MSARWCYACQVGDHESCIDPNCGCGCRSFFRHDDQKPEREMLKVMDFAFDKIIGKRRPE